MQVSSLLRDIPDTGHAYTYGLGSLLGALALGIIIYGSGVWAR